MDFGALGGGFQAPSFSTKLALGRQGSAMHRIIPVSAPRDVKCRVTISPTFPGRSLLVKVGFWVAGFGARLRLGELGAWRPGGCQEVRCSCT